MAPTDSTKKVLEDFIEIYKMNPCLWQVKNKEYHDRDKKEAAGFVSLFFIINVRANKASGSSSDAIMKKLKTSPVRRRHERRTVYLRRYTSPVDRNVYGRHKLTGVKYFLIYHNNNTNNIYKYII